MESLKEFLDVKLSTRHGSGSWDGSEYGYGSGAGSGSGDGDEAGYGFGSGSGFGYEAGYLNNISQINGMEIHRIDKINTVITQFKKGIAKGLIINADLTTEKCFVVKSENVFAHGKTLKDAQKALMDKVMINSPVEDRINAFAKEFKLEEKYPARKFYEWHYRLTGSCEMGRFSFCKNRDIDLDKDMMTVDEFVELAKDAYGGEILIQALKSKAQKKGEK